MTPLDPTTRFTGRVADYVHARPHYPDRLVHLLVGELGLEAGGVIADIGSGTGLSAVPFLRQGFRVLGVEPNTAMRAAAEEALGPHPGFRSVAGTAEATGLGAGTVDLVLVAQAFHWFDAPAARREFRRILRPEGRVCLVWNTRRTTGTRFLEGYEALLRRFGTDYDEVRRRTAALTGAADAGDAGADGPDRLAAFFGGPYERRTLENRQELDLDGLRRRLRSASYVPAEDSPRHAPMMDALAALFEAEARGGRVRLEYDLEIFFGAIRDGPDSGAA